MSIQTIEITKAVQPLADYVRHADIEPTVITEQGKPLAVVISVEDIDWESVSLNHNPRFSEIIQHSRDSQNRGKSLSSDEMREFLGLKS